MTESAENLQTAPPAAAAPRRPRDSSSLRVQAARGLACLLLVTYHVIGTDPLSGIRVEDGSLYRYFTDLFLPIRMPLFTFLSGFVYAYKPMIPSQWLQFAQRKLVRLGLPLMAASTVTFLTLILVAAHTGEHHGIGGHASLHDLWKIYIYPLRHLWFLQALMGVMACVMVLEALGALTTLGRFLLVFVVALLAFEFSPAHHILAFSFNHVSFLLPFFLLGLAANRFSSTLLSPRILVPCGVLFGAAFVVYAHMATMGHRGVSVRNALLPAALGMSAVLCIVRWLPPVRFLQWIGGYSFSIYLYHFAIVVLIGLAAEDLGVHGKQLLLLVGIAAGTALPMLLERSLPAQGIARLILLGQRRKRRQAEDAAVLAATGVQPTRP